MAMSQESQADQNMQSVPLEAVSVQGSRQPSPLNGNEADAKPGAAQMSGGDEGAAGRANASPNRLLTDPSADVETLAREIGDQKGGSSYDAHADDALERHASVKDADRSTISLLLEALLVALLMMVPCAIIQRGASYERYSFWLVKGTEGLNSFREFERWSVFLALSYIILILGEVAFRQLPAIIMCIHERLDIKLDQTARTAIISIKYISAYLGFSVAALLIYRLATGMLFESSRQTAIRVALADLNAAEASIAKSLMLGEQIESFLAAAFLLFFFVALQKYLMANVTSSFHRNTLAPRISQCNAKFEVLAILYRAASLGGRSASISAANFLTPRGTEHAAEFESHALMQASELALNSKASAKAAAETIFKGICPAGQEEVTSVVFKSYFAPGEHELAFNTFDQDRAGRLTLESFTDAVVAIFEERIRTARALINNTGLIAKLDWFLFVMFLLCGFLFAVVILSKAGFAIVSSIGAFLAGLSFLFKTTVGQIFDSFIFVFAEHAYDVCDKVIIGKERRAVKEVQIFTTQFITADGAIMYSPHSKIKTLPVYNKQRARTEKDSLSLVASSSLAIEKIDRMRAQLAKSIEERVNEFSGAVTINVVGIEGGKAHMELVVTYRPRETETNSAAALAARRAALMEQFSELNSGEGGMGATIA